MLKVLITGGSGLVGRPLTAMLLAQGHEVRHLSRNPGSQGAVKVFRWDPMNGTMDENAVKGVDAIIHLAGAGIADERWTEDRKQLIIDSRVKSAELLHQVCNKHNVKLRSYISASAIGYYPNIVSENTYDESSPQGNSYLSDVCSSWEASADQFTDIADHVAKIRIGLVLSEDGGALELIERPIRLYVGAGLGSGKQYVSWIHVTDVCKIFVHVLQKQLRGIYNAVGSEPTTNNVFTQTLADIMDRPILLPNIPEFVVKFLYGEMSVTILTGVPVSSKKIAATGFEFDYPTLSSALFNIYWK